MRAVAGVYALLLITTWNPTWVLGALLWWAAAYYVFRLELWKNRVWKPDEWVVTGEPLQPHPVIYASVRLPTSYWRANAFWLGVLGAPMLIGSILSHLASPLGGIIWTLLSTAFAGWLVRELLHHYSYRLKATPAGVEVQTTFSLHQVAWHDIRKVDPSYTILISRHNREILEMDSSGWPAEQRMRFFETVTKNRLG